MTNPRALTQFSAPPDTSTPGQGLQVVPPALDTGGPQFETHLKLNEEREKWLVDRALKRIAEVAVEMGLDPDGQCAPDKWMAVRERGQRTYDNELEWRKRELGGIFTESNLTLGTTKRYVREMGAKVNDDILGTTPFFGAVKRNGATDPRAVELAKGTEEYVQQQVDLSNLQQCLMEGQQVALIRNEAVVKVRQVKRSHPFYGPATVLIGPDGQPVYTNTGMLVYQDDLFLPDPFVQGQYRLQKDPTFVRPLGQGLIRYQSFPSLRQEQIEYEGIEGAILDYRSFLCPLRVDDVKNADINVQLYDETLEVLEETYRGFKQFDEYARARNSLEASGELMPRRSQGERDDDNKSAVLHRASIAEVYIRADADNDGFEEQIFLVLDLDAKKPVFYEYLANQMKERPFNVIVGVERVPNRWYGVGIMHMMFDPNHYIDTQFNRYNLKDSREASVTFRDPSAVKEWKAGLPVVLGSNDIYDVEPGYDHQERPPIWRVNLQETSEIGMELIHIMQQQTDLQFGVISSKDASASNLNQSRTATGILNLERASNVLTKVTETHQIIGIEKILSLAVDLILENMKPMETFFSKDGAVLMTISRDEARTIEREIKLLLTRSRSTELLATNQQALQIARDYHLLKSQDPGTARDLRPLYVNQLKGLEVMDADELLPEISDQDIQAWQAQMAKPPVAPPKSPTELINYKDAPPPIRRQIEAAAGYQPMTDAQSAEHEPPPLPEGTPKPAAK